MTNEKSAAIPINGSQNQNGSPNGDGPDNYCSPSHMMSFVDISDLDRTGSLERRNEILSRNADASSRMPVDLLPGEILEDKVELVTNVLYLTNYRICIVSADGQSITVLALMSMENVDFRDPVYVTIVCRDSRTFRLQANNYEEAIRWHKRLVKCMNARQSVHDSFAYKFAESASTCEIPWLADQQEQENLCTKEWKRLDYDPDYFRIYDGNEDFEHIKTYPEKFIVPKDMTNEDVKACKEFRFLERIPAVVWKSKETKAVLLRSSQPRLGVFGWRNSADEKILECVKAYMTRHCRDQGAEVPKIYILDARSYSAAFANRAKGGGFESPEYYGGSETLFLGLPNIHNVRWSFSQLRNTIAVQTVDQNAYLSGVQSSNWIQYLSNLIQAALRCVDYLLEGSPVLVHCSDGWDRTSQIVSYTKLIADEYYRTVQGFEDLIRREWIEFGHKFADRNGVSGLDSNERAPVFLQWLEGVWHMMEQNPTAFQFNQQYLIKLSQHTYSGLFGTFLFNSQSEAREALKVAKGEPVSLWRFLGPHNEEVVNQLYNAAQTKGRITVKVGVQHMHVWRQAYVAEQTADGLATTESSQSQPPAASAPLQKSKSSESINSLHTVDGNQVTNGLNNAHSESNGTLNTVNSETHHIQMDGSVVSESGRARVRSAPVRPKNIRELVDSDGLVRFYDPIQEKARQKEREHKLQIRQREVKINDLARQRSFSERTNHSGVSRDSAGRMISVGEDEHEMGSLDRAYSDISMVDHADVPPPGGWAVRQDSCFVCKRQFGKLALSADDREHHCRHCGNAVCGSCSPYSYHEIHEGQGVQRRCCKVCYGQMQRHDDPVVDADEEDIDAEDSAREDAENRDNRQTGDALIHNGSFHNINGCAVKDGSPTKPLHESH